MEWRGVAAERTLPWYALVYDPKTQETRGFSVAVGAASFASWRIDEIAWEQNQQWLDILSCSGTALFVSAHPEAVGPEQKAALRDAFARAALPQPPAEPLDWQDTTAPRRWLCGGETHTYDWSPFPGEIFACPR